MGHKIAAAGDWVQLYPKFHHGGQNISDLRRLAAKMLPIGNILSTAYIETTQIYLHNVQISRRLAANVTHGGQIISHLRRLASKWLQLEPRLTQRLELT